MPRLSVDTIIKTALTLAKRQAERVPSEQESEEVRRALAYLWSLVKQNLVAEDERVRLLDQFIPKLVGDVRT